MNSNNVSLVIIIAITALTIGLIGYCVVDGTQVPSIVQALLGVVLGFLGSHLASSQGATQALATPVVTSSPTPVATQIEESKI